MKVCGVYSIRSPSGKEYIGSSANVHQRWKEHLSLLTRDKHDNYKLQHAWNKYGELMVFEVLVRASPGLLVEIEQAEIDRRNARSLYNLALVVTKPCLGFKASEETRAKLRIERRTRRHSPETKRKIGDAHRGKKLPPLSAEARAKISRAHTGKVLSQTTKDKVRDAKLGKPLSYEHRKAMSAGQAVYRYRCVEHDRWFESHFEVEAFLRDEHGIQTHYVSIQSSLSAVARGAAKTAFGFHWQRVLKEDTQT